MAQVAFAAKAFADFERIYAFYAEHDRELAAAQMQSIREAIMILAHHPFIGRQVRHGFRELVISRGKSGFVALYRFVPRLDVVQVLRIRHQRELGYP